MSVHSRRQFAARESRTQRFARERDIAKKIAQQTQDGAERIRLWHEQTDKNKSAFYDRLKETDFNESESSESRKPGKSETRKRVA